MVLSILRLKKPRETVICFGGVLHKPKQLYKIKKQKKLLIMKKLIFLFTMVLAVSMAMAQTNNTSEISQSGVKQTATVDQQGMGDNTSYVTQSNANNIATISQVNPIIDGSLDTDDILSTVTQTGANNNATVSQIHDNNTVHALSGGLLEARILQTGNNNDAEQIQGSDYRMGESLATIEQSGNRNYAFQHQIKFGNIADINQSGNGNKAWQAQDIDLPEEGSKNKASIVQSGNNNESQQLQNGWRNNVEAIQSGSNNTSLQFQEDRSWKSKSFVYQEGNNNLAKQSSVGFLNNATIEQYSSGNTAKQVQTSGGTTYQDVSSLNDAEIYQWGSNGNIAVQNQYNEEGSLANKAFIEQNGKNNFAKQDQLGGFNSSMIWQTGNGNIANVMQNQAISY